MTAPGDDRLPAAGEILATVALAVAPRQEPTYTWHRPPDGSLVVAVLHGAGCRPCLGYAAALAGQLEEYRAWGGQAMLVVPSLDAPARALAARSPLRVLVDQGGAARSRWCIGPGDAAVLVTDRWHQVYLAAGAGTAHRLPDPAAEILDVLTAIGIQCPECGVLDAPGPSQPRSTALTPPCR